VFTVTARPAALPSRVRAGVIALDFVEPLWFIAVNEHTMDVRSDTRCPLGQLWGRFSRGLKALDIPEDSAALYGFDSPTALAEEGFEDVDTVDREYATLSRIWRYVVRVRTECRIVIAT
jgi:hypothetical protein